MRREGDESDKWCKVIQVGARTEKPETEVESEKVHCFSLDSETWSPSDLGDVILGDSSLGLTGADGDGSSSRS